MTNQLGYGGSFQGGVIYRPAGEQVGIWYSQYFKTSIKFGENNEINISVARWQDTDGGGSKLVFPE
jgi:hypothetical protein